MLSKNHNLDDIQPPETLTGDDLGALNTTTLKLKEYLKVRQRFLIYELRCIEKFLGLQKPK